MHYISISNLAQKQNTLLNKNIIDILFLFWNVTFKSKKKKKKRASTNLFVNSVMWKFMHYMHALEGTWEETIETTNLYNF